MIFIRSEQEVKLIAQSCKIVARALKLAGELVKAGVTTHEIDSEVEKFIKSNNGRPAFKGFNGYPASTCISIDSQVVHGIPSSRKLRDGEIVGVDLGVELNGFYGDAAITFSVGEVSPEKQRLMDITKSALAVGIDQARVGNRLHDISHAIQTVVEDAGYSVVRQLVGHGIGRNLHEDPQIPNYGKAKTGPRLKAGMVFAIEPMVNMGHYDVITEDDEWTVRTADNLPSAHFEHTVVITQGDPLILTLQQNS